ncbi:MAG: YraN family protein [Gemmatimonadota bacterium]|jgi:putative endonuclease
MGSPAEYAPHALGRWGERHAARFLREKGWSILARNYRFGRREVDLIVRRRDIVAFVEVKTRAGGEFGCPEEAITHLKRREIEAVATHFLARHAPAGLSVRFDAVAIVVDTGARTVRIRHVEDAWRPGWQ